MNDTGRDLEKRKKAVKRKRSWMKRYNDYVDCNNA